MEIARWIVGGAILAFGLFVAASNWIYIYLNTQNQKNGVDRHFSQAPILGPVAIGMGLLFLPYAKPFWLWFLPLIDPSTWILLAAVHFMIREARSGAIELTEDEMRNQTRSSEQDAAGQPATRPESE